MPKTDGVIGLIVVLLGLGVIGLTLALPPASLPRIPGPAYLPRLVCAALILCGLLLIIKSRRGRGERPVGFNAESKKKVLGAILLAGLTPLGMSYLGFLTTGVLSCFAFLMILRARLWLAVVTSVLITTGVYLVFHYGLQVQFPTQMIW
jgi:hypothetical protein